MGNVCQHEKMSLQTHWLSEHRLQGSQKSCAPKLGCNGCKFTRKEMYRANITWAFSWEIGSLSTTDHCCYDQCLQEHAAMCKEFVHVAGG